MKINEFPNEKNYELLAEDFPNINQDIMKSYLEYILICQKTIAKIESYLSKIEMTNSQFLILLCLYTNDKKIDNITNISKKLGISVDEMIKNNPTSKEGVAAGQMLTYFAPKKYFSTQTQPVKTEVVAKKEIPNLQFHFVERLN